ncbi:MAG: DUF3570 domain-containing protein [Labilithrix sp.]|nr:DUF3570 domain-containing protein [Labilithrix sp.]
MAEAARRRTTSAPARARTRRALAPWVALLALLVHVHAYAAPRVAQRRPAAPAPAPAAERPSRGWSNPRALELAKEGIDAKKRGDLALCIQKDQASLILEDHPYVRLHVSSCLAGQGRFKDALIAARDALAAGIRNEDEDLKRAALARVQELLPKLAKLKLAIPNKTQGLKITLTPAVGAGTAIRPSQLKGPISVDPGEYTIEAVREDKGDRYLFREKITLDEGEEREVEILPKKDHLPGEVEECLRNAKTYKERLKCIEESSTHPNVHVGIDVSAYTDSTAVHVLTPAINASVVSPTGGWNVGGSYLLDMVTAASPDLVSTASRSFHEERHAASLNGGYKLSFADVGLNGNVSSEPDYLSRTLGGSISTELNDKLITPRLGYNYSWDTIGYRNTPFSQFSRALTTHAIEAGVTFVLSPTTLLVTGVSMGFERGENSKLYRFIPMFPADIAPRIPAGATVALVNEERLSFRPREFVPQQRDRLAIGARVNHRFGNGTLRVEERLYTDNWGIKASTTDGRYLHDLGERLRVWPHLRLHAQSGASFYQLAYTGVVDGQGTPVEIPRYRTTDREASPMVAITAGGGARIALTNEKAPTQYAIVVSGDVMYNRYFESLFILSRTAVWGTLGFDAEF